MIEIGAGSSRPVKKQQCSLPLAGRTAAQTGTSRRIGCAIALRLAQDSADVSSGTL
jgi:hypothetical protein